LFARAPHVISVGSFEKNKEKYIYPPLYRTEGSDREFNLVHRPNIRFEFWYPIAGQKLVIPQVVSAGTLNSDFDSLSLHASSSGPGLVNTSLDLRIVT